MSVNQLFGGAKQLAKAKSAINGELTVVKDLAWGVHILGGGLTQSGGVAELVWKTTLKKVAKQHKSVGMCLILGLGGGSIAKLVRKRWPAVSITGVDIDPVIVKLGQDYMGMTKHGVDVVIADAYKYMVTSTEKSKKFDLMCVDTYQGDEFPEKFATPKFLNLIRDSLAVDGVVVFNRLYYGQKRSLAVKFGEQLEKVFDSVEAVYPEANIMFVCR